MNTLDNISLSRDTEHLSNNTRAQSAPELDQIGIESSDEEWEGTLHPSVMRTFSNQNEPLMESEIWKISTCTSKYLWFEIHYKDMLMLTNRVGFWFFWSPGLARIGFVSSILFVLSQWRLSVYIDIILYEIKKINVTVSTKNLTWFLLCSYI